MTVKELSDSLQTEVLCMPKGERDVSGAYIGDLLSWVMGRAQSGNVWITIMSNINVVAVASLSDVSCVVFAEGVTPDSDIVNTANEKGINLLRSPLAAFDVAQKLIGKV